MQDLFLQHLNQQHKQLINARVLVAISGGLDSVVLAHLLHHSSIRIALAHCNFNLRSEESDADELFVKKLSKELSCPVYTQRFDTKSYAQEHQVSIQMAARDLRFMWFEELRREKNYEYIVTAHHANDDLETYLINLGRGSGIEGLTGIPAQNGNILRPLLAFSRKQILAYAQHKELSWREDSSNASDKYLRNHLRHHVIPQLEAGTPHFLNAYQASKQHLQQAHALLQDYTAYLYSQIVTKDFRGYQINLSKLAEFPNTAAILYQLLKDFGFTAWEDVSNLVTAQSGKWVSSGTHRLIKDRGVLLLTVEPEMTQQSHSIKSNATSIKTNNLQLSWSIEEEFNSSNNPKEAWFDKELLKYPLILRKWKEGDYFYPFGMNGKKKVSKFFKDEKFSLLAKEEVWVLCSDDHIIWVVGHRIDDRFKVTSKTSKIIKFKAVYDS